MAVTSSVRLRNQLPPVKAPAAVSVLLPTAGEIVGKYMMITCRQLIILLLCAPSPRAARFSRDGSVVSIVFDSWTDTYELGYSSFVCSTLLVFYGNNISTCRWFDDATLDIIMDENVKLNVSDAIVVLGNKIKAKCLSSLCSTLSTTAESIVTIDFPSYVDAPILSIDAPQVLGYCDDLKLDLSDSSGGLGRDWSDVTLSVVSTPDTDLSLLLEHLETFNAVDFRHVVYIPREYLVSSLLYTFQIYVENFLGGFSQSTFSVLVLSSPIPTVSILGPSQRRVYSRVGLSLFANASTTICSSDENITSSQLSDYITLSWSIFDANGILLVDLVSEAYTPSRFLLKPFSLLPNQFYTVQVDAYDSKWRELSSARVSIQVISAKVVAVISQGSFLTIPNATIVKVDGSTSYDENFEQSQLLYKWSCSTVSPSLSLNCPFSIIGSSTSSTLDIISVSTVANITGKIALEVESEDGRLDTTHVYVSVKPYFVPISTIGIDGRDINNVNPARKLAITARVTVRTASYVEWFIQDHDFISKYPLDMESIALTKSTMSISPPPHSKGVKPVSVNLVLKSNALLSNSRYKLTLSCTEINSNGKRSSFLQSVVLRTNRPPSSGVLDILPVEGVAVSTIFDMNALMWEDQDLPLTYEFGYSPNGIELPLSEKSELKSISTPLSAALEHNNYISKVVLVVADCFNAFVNKSYGVKVISASNDLENLLSYSGDKTSQYYVSASVGTLNAINCSLAPNCTSLHRLDCFDVPHTCGSCQDGFEGEYGSHNSVCLPSSDISVYYSNPLTNYRRQLIGFASCDECFAWEECGSNPENGDITCFRSQKNCSDPHCSEHGVCQFVSTSYPFHNVSSCLLDSSECEAKCFCEPDYYGATCSYNASVYYKRSLLRNATSQSLLAIIRRQIADTPPSEEFVYGHVLSVRSLFLLPDEISLEIGLVSMEIIGLILDSAGKLVSEGAILSREKLVGLLDPLRTVLNICLKNSHPISPVLSLINALGYLLAVDMTVGESVRNYVSGNIRLQFSGFDISNQDSIFEIAQTPLESAVGLEVEAIHFDLVELDDVHDVVGWTIKLSSSEMITLTGEQIYNADIFSLRMIYATSKTQAVRIFNDKAFSVTLKNRRATYYSNASSTALEGDGSVSIKTECRRNDGGSYQSLICPDTGYQHKLGCDSAGIHTLQCPPRKLVVQPNCAQVSLDNSAEFETKDCKLVDFDALQTTCSCKIGEMAPRDHLTRSLPLDLELSSITEQKVEPSERYGLASTEFETQLEDSDLPTVVWSVFITLVTLVCANALILALSYFIDIRCEEQLLEYESPNNFPSCIADAVGNLDDSVNLIGKALPYMYRLSQRLGRLELLLHETQKHHKWISMAKILVYPFYPRLEYRHNYFQKMILLSGDVLSALAVLTIILLTWSDAFNDTSICSKFNNEGNCTGTFSESLSVSGFSCEWKTESSTCAAIVLPTTYHWVIAISALLTALIATPVASFMRWLLQEYTFALTQRNSSSRFGLSRFIPASCIEYILSRQPLSSYNGWSHFLKEQGFSGQFRAALQLACSDAHLLEQQIRQHSEHLDEMERRHFNDVWGLPSFEEGSGRWQHRVAPLSHLKHPRLSEQDDFDPVIQQLFRANLVSLREGDVIVKQLQHSKEPLSEIRALELLIEDLVSDHEASILRTKRKSEGSGALEVPAKPFTSRALSTFIVLMYFWVCGYIVYYYTSTPFRDSQHVWAGSFCTWLLLDVVVFQTFYSFVYAFYIPSLISEKLMLVQSLISRCVCELDCYSFIEASKFKWSLLLYASAKVVSRYYSSRMGELLSVLVLNIPLRSAKISSYPVKALKRLNCHNSTVKSLIEMKSKNWEAESRLTTAVTYFLEGPVSCILPVEVLSMLISCGFLLGALHLYYYFGLSALLLTCLGLLLVVLLLYSASVLKRATKPKSRTDRYDDMHQLLGKKAYVPRKKRVKIPAVTAEKSEKSDDDSIVFHESVVCDNSIDSDGELGASLLKKMEEKYLQSSSTKMNSFVEENSLFSALLDQENAVALQKNHEFREEEACVSSDQRSIGDSNNKYAIKSISEVNKELKTTAKQPEGLFESPLLPEADNTSLFSEVLVQEDGTVDQASRKTAHDENPFKNCDPGSVSVPPSLEAFLAGRSEDERLHLLLELADKTVGGGVSTKHQLLDAVLRKTASEHRVEPNADAQEHSTSHSYDATKKTAPKEIEEDGTKSNSPHSSQQSSAESGSHSTSAPTSKPASRIRPSRDNRIIYRAGYISFSGNAADNKRLSELSPAADTPTSGLREVPDDSVDFAERMTEYARVFKSTENVSRKRKPHK